MTIHTLNIGKHKDPQDLFADSTPPITAGLEVYIQNVSDADVWIAEDDSMTHALLLTKKGSATSVMTVTAGSTAWVDTQEEIGTLKLQVETDV